MQFIDFVYPHFQDTDWQNGISIFSSGGVLNYQNYKELVAAKIHSGMGASFDVRIKFQTDGRFVQWMECTCPQNRKSGQRCPHIAAFCIYLDQSEKKFLDAFKFETGSSQNHLESRALRFDPDKLSQKHLKSSYSLVQSQKQESTHLASLLDENMGMIRKEDVEFIELDQIPPWINVKIRNKQKEQWVFRLGLDDGYFFIKMPEYKKKIDKKLYELISHDLVAERILYLFIDKDDYVNIKKMFRITDSKEKQSRLINFSEVNPSYIGNNVIYFSTVGYIPFQDEFTRSQILRWQEYPILARIDADHVVKLLETDFQSLREICNVEIDEKLKTSKIINKIEVKNYKISKSHQDSFVLEDIELDLSSSAGNSHEKRISILEILKNKRLERKYIQNNNVFYKISTEYDWLKSKISETGKLVLSRLDYIKFYEQMAGNAEVKSGVDIIEKLRRGIISRDDLEIPNISQSKLALRPYQEDGLKWLWWLYSNELGGLLADEMGLGKTHQAMALMSAINYKKQDNYFLVISPTTVIDHWVDKLQKYTPEILTQAYHGVKRKPFVKTNNYNSLAVITSYGILLRDLEFIMQHNWELVILDEAHLIKNQKTRTYKSACKIKSGMRLCLTGTPLENNLLELKNLFDYIVPSYLGTDKDFKKKYFQQEDISHADPLSIISLQKLIYPFKLRRHKVDVLHDLPEKVEDIKHCYLNEIQLQLYKETLKLKGTAIFDSLKESDSPFPYIHIFSLITTLKQICNDPSLVHPKFEKYGSNKLLLLDQLIQECLENDQKIVIFSQYAKMVNIISKRLTHQGIEHVTLTGMSVKRGDIVRNFQENKEIKVFVGSLLAGGTGIDLTSANIVIHFDRWWNSAKEEQATDRIYRIGQTKNVQVYKIVTKGTLEERIDQIISRKKYIFDKYVNQDEQVLKNLTREELLDVLKEPEELTFH